MSVDAPPAPGSVVGSDEKSADADDDEAAAASSDLGSCISSMAQPLSLLLKQLKNDQVGNVHTTDGWIVVHVSNPRCSRATRGTLILLPL